MAKNPNDGSRKPRDILGSEAISVLNDIGAVIIAQLGLGAARNMIGGLFCNNMSTIVPRGEKLDNTGINTILAQFSTNVDATDLPTDMKQELKSTGRGRILEAIATLSDSRITPAERQLRAAKLAEDLSNYLLKAQARRHTFQARIFDMLSEGDRKQFVSWQVALNDAQKQRWLAIRESIESPAVLADVLKNVADAEQGLMLLETMAAKPKSAPIGKTLHDAFDQFRMLFEHDESPLPARTAGESDDDYFSRIKADLAKRHITTASALLEYERDVRERGQRRQRRQQADEADQASWENLLGQWK